VDSAHVVAPDETYASTVGANISGETALPPGAWGDSDVVVEAVLAVVNAAHPPRRLAVGEPAVESIRRALQTSVKAAWGPTGGMAF
jgi:hypothetical protein